MFYIPEENNKKELNSNEFFKLIIAVYNVWAFFNLLEILTNYYFKTVILITEFQISILAIIIILKYLNLQHQWVI